MYLTFKRLISCRSKTKFHDESAASVIFIELKLPDEGSRRCDASCLSLEAVELKE
jgi:hypothetical protein